MRRITAAVAALTLTVAAPLWAQPATPVEPPATISVSGTMVTQVPPDIIVWNLDITQRSAALKDAKAACDAATARVLNVIKALNTASADVQTGQLNVRREYNRDNNSNQTPKGWIVSRAIALKQRELARFDEIFAELVDAADVELSFRFESSRFHELRGETRLKAVEMAKQKAQALSEALGVTLGQPISVEERGSRPPAGMENGGFSSSNAMPWYVSNAPNMTAPAAAPAVEDAATGTMAPGVTEIRETVFVTFKIQ